MDAFSAGRPGAVFQDPEAERALAALRLTPAQRAALRTQGFVSAERRGERTLYKLRFREEGQQRVRSLGGDPERARLVARALARHQQAASFRRDVQRLVRFVDRRLREIRRQLAPLLAERGLFFHGGAVREARAVEPVRAIRPVRSFEVDRIRPVRPIRPISAFRAFSRHFGQPLRPPRPQRARKAKKSRVDTTAVPRGRSGRIASSPARAATGPPRTKRSAPLGSPSVARRDHPPVIQRVAKGLGRGVHQRQLLVGGEPLRGRRQRSEVDDEARSPSENRLVHEKAIQPIATAKGKTAGSAPAGHCGCDVTPDVPYRSLWNP